jgi:hypothetical protein
MGTCRRQGLRSRCRRVANKGSNTQSGAQQSPRRCTPCRPVAPTTATTSSTVIDVPPFAFRLRIAPTCAEAGNVAREPTTLLPEALDLGGAESMASLVQEHACSKPFRMNYSV